MSDMDTTPVVDANRAPTVIAERCVHTKLAQASCSNCIDACPLDAWVIDDEALAIDANRCDGCGLCAANCRPGAILAPKITAVVNQHSHSVLCLACEMAEIEGQPGVIPCLHALGLHDLLLFYRHGTRCLTVISGDCASCNRHSVQRLHDRVAHLNRMLSGRKLVPMTLKEVPSEQWLQLSEKIRADVRAPVLSRRSFIRKAAESPLSLALGSSAQETQQGFTPPAKLLPRSKPNDLVPFVPSIDVTKCSGCDACVRLCPQAAMSLGITINGGLEYRFDAESCTGCGICTDVCTQNAVRVDSWASQTLFTLNLASRHCVACGTPFHIPASQDASGDRCVICAHTNHIRNLYQVLDQTQ